jgi:hypothetical protein
VIDEKAIAQAVQQALRTIPSDVFLVAAVKGRTALEVQAAIRAGISIIGHNYVQEAKAMVPLITEPVQWHCIGHLQSNKAKTAVQLFDMIETVDSLAVGQELERRCAALGKRLPVLIEVNSGSETNKAGVRPEYLEELIVQLGALPHLAIQGLMTIGPLFGDPEETRPFYQTTRHAFERLTAANLPNIEMRYLSMGMSNSYRIAIEEGANMVRLGTILFGPRP